MTPQDLGIQTPSLGIGVHQGRVIFQHGETRLGFEPHQAIMLASLLLQNAVKAMNPANMVSDAAEKVFKEPEKN